ncbi:MAG: DUF4364 family protein [Clostridia bacterium]
MPNLIDPTNYNENALNRLILLYLLDQLEAGSTDMHINSLLLENHLMDYFTLQFQLFGLIDAKLVTQRFTDEERVVFSITPAGRDVLKNLSGTIPAGIRLNIDNLVAPLRAKIREDNQITADFTPTTSKRPGASEASEETQEPSFQVTCAAAEDDFDLIKIDVQIGTRKHAIDVCHNWKKHSQDIYAEILAALTKERSED